MKEYLKYDEWVIREDQFHPENNEVTESIMSLGNGQFGIRGNFEERFSGKSLQGSYIAGVWYPDKTRVGWWKNGYPDYFAKVINSVNWIGIDVILDDEIIDLTQVKIIDFYRELNLKSGIFLKKIILETSHGKQVKIVSSRFCSTDDTRLAQINYRITPLNFSGRIALVSYLDGDVKNRDSNHNEIFWDTIDSSASLDDTGFVHVKTTTNSFKVPQFNVAVGMKNEISREEIHRSVTENSKYAGIEYEINLNQNESLTLRKTVAILNSNNYAADNLKKEISKLLQSAPVEKLQKNHIKAWEKTWNECDIVIEGDISAQLGIRFNIFHLLQTYDGSDARLNIGPKGFTGEKYGGVTYWDTEAYCLPFYTASKDFSIAKNLLIYRHNHLEKAIENAKKLGFKNGAALYPMVTMNGEECHNEWEITFEEIHRNGAIAYAIYDYINHTGDHSYLAEYGLEVLIAISRFWAQRVNWSEDKQKYVILGVTGPNEYENNVNNNWYTNYIAVWTLRYTLETIDKTDYVSTVFKKVNFQDSEINRWNDIIENMYFPYDEERQVFLQQDGFLDKNLQHVDEISGERPINQNWSWDRILRSCFIKQADVLQGLYFFEDHFDKETHKRNFDFYEPMTVHESSLSPCVHTILAAKLGKNEKAYEMYLRTARLDLDNYNNDTEDGLHITSMAGTWLAVIKGFAGLRIRDTQLSVNPSLPPHWSKLAFKIRTVEGVKEVVIDQNGHKINEGMKK